MFDNKTIHFIPPLHPKREKRVEICCRVSTNGAEQLKSLTAQVLQSYITENSMGK